MMFDKLDVLNAFSICDIFNLWCVYQDITPLWVKEDLYSKIEGRVTHHSALTIIITWPMVFQYTPLLLHYFKRFKETFYFQMGGGTCNGFLHTVSGKTKDSYPWEMGSKQVEPYECPSWLPWERYQTVEQEKEPQ